MPQTDAPGVVARIRRALAHIAWNPLTPRGAAKFAGASFANLFAVQFVFATAFTWVACWFLLSAWFPPVTRAIQQLPAAAAIRAGLLTTPATSMVLVEDRFLGASIISTSDRELPAPTVTSDLRLELRKTHARICSLFGYASIPYDPRYIVELSRAEAEPWWGAWRPIIIGAVAVGLPLLLFACWWLLATVYAPIAWLIAFFADRDLSLVGSWRIASASLLPGALVMSLGVLAYGLQTIDLVKFLTVAGLHIVVGWAFLVATPFSRPTIKQAQPAKNPFAVENPAA